MMKFSILAVTCVAALGSATQALALTIPYTTDTATYTDLGGASPGDTLTLGAASGTFTGPGTYTLNDVSFHVTRFAVNPTPFTGTFTDTAHSGSLDYNYGVSYSLQLGGLDTITLGGNSFFAGGFDVTINPLILTTGVDQTTTGVLTATVSPSGVPEPASWALMLIGAGFVGATIRRRGTQVST